MREAHLTIGDSELSAMGIEELVALAERAGLRDVDELSCEGDSAVITVEVETRLDEATVDGLAYVEEWEHVATAADAHVYVVAFTAPGLSERTAEATEPLVGTCDPEQSRDGVRVSLTGPQEAIAGAVDAYKQDGVSPDLRKLGPYDPRDDPLAALTDRQEEVLRTAVRTGYYEVPRGATTSEVASELELDPSTVTEHLQRAERALLTRLLSRE